MERLNLVLFGSFHATLGARPVELPLKKAQALLAFLALAPGHRCARERLAGLLWSDTPDEQARNSLRQTLFAIRSALGRTSARYLAGDAASVWLESSASMSTSSRSSGSSRRTATARSSGPSICTAATCSMEST
jgi:DNA-binding SARP family transcriptional activator